MEPLGLVKHNVQRFLIAGIAVHVQKTHHFLVAYVLRSPGLLAVFQPPQPLFRDGEAPFAAVFILAAGNLGDDLPSLQLQFFVAGFMDELGSGTEPMPGKLAAKVGEWSVPALMDPFQPLVAAVQSRLKQVGAEQVLCFQFHQIAAVPLPVNRQQTGKKMGACCQ